MTQNNENSSANTEQKDFNSKNVLLQLRWEVQKNNLDKLKSFELNENEYKTEYDKMKWILENSEKTIKTFAKKLQDHSSELTLVQFDSAVSLINNFNSLLDEFYTNILLPQAYNEEKIKKEKEKAEQEKNKKIDEENKTKEEEQEKNKPIDLWNLSPRSSFKDIPLTTEELMQLKPEQLIAKTKGWVEYYKVKYNWNTTLLRFNSKDNSDEIALYENVNLDSNASKDDFKRFIIMVERQWKFQEVEMEDSKGISNVWMVASWLATSAWLTAWTMAWLWATTWLVWWATTWLAWAWAALITPPGWIAWLWALWGVVIWWVVASATDLDYTTADYKQDFGNEINALINVSQPPQQAPQ